MKIKFVLILAAIISISSLSFSSESTESKTPSLLSATTQPGYREHISRSEQITAALTSLTGEAINPLLGITARSFYVWWNTKSELRPKLVWYYQPRVWFPLLLLMIAMLFKSTIAEAAPPLKKVLDAAGDLISKAGGVFSIPIVLAMFADSFTLPAAEAVQGAADFIFPAAHAAGGGGAVENFYYVIGWIVSLTLGTTIYAIVWFAFNTIDVLILISPFPAVDASLKSLRIAVIGGLLAIREWDPLYGAIASGILILFALLIAGWSMRLSVFGFIYSTDMLLLRSRRMKSTAEGIYSFSNNGLKEQYKIPMRTWGKAKLNDEDKIEFTYRPWLVFKRKSIVLDTETKSFSLGKGLLNLYVIKPQEENEFATLLRLPPRYNNHEEEVKTTLKLGDIRDASILRGVKALFSYLSDLIAGNSKGMI